MKNIFDSLGEFFQSHRLFGESRAESCSTSSQKRAKSIIAHITPKDLNRYGRHKDKPKSIFNPRNTQRLVHYRTERFYLLDRDGRLCVYCGPNSEGKALEVDHILPYTKIPVTHIDNLAMACVECNGGKSDIIMSRQTLTDILCDVYSRNEAHFPRKKFKEYRRDYAKLIRE